MDQRSAVVESDQLLKKVVELVESILVIVAMTQWIQPTQPLNRICGVDDCPNPSQPVEGLPIPECCSHTSTVSLNGSIRTEAAK